MEKNNKFTRQQISGIGEAYHQITEAMSVSSSAATSSRNGISGLGGVNTPGLGPDGKSSFVQKPSATTGKLPSGDKKVGHGWTTSKLNMVEIQRIIGKVPGLNNNVDYNNAESIYHGLNQAKQHLLQKDADEVANKFGMRIDRTPTKDADIEKAIELMNTVKKAWAEKAESHEKKLNDAKMKVTTDLWMNPSNRTSAAVDAVAKWRDLNMGSDAGKRPGDPQGQQEWNPPLRPAYRLRDVPLVAKDPTSGPPQGPIFPSYNNDPDDVRRWSQYFNPQPGQKVDVVGMPEDPGSGVMDNEWYNPPGNPDDINVGHEDYDSPYYIPGYGDDQQGDGNPQGQQAPGEAPPPPSWYQEPVGRESEPGDVDPHGHVKRTWLNNPPRLTRTFPWEPKRPTPTLGDPMRGHITPDKGIMGMPGTPWGPGGENQPPAQGQQAPTGKNARNARIDTVKKMMEIKKLENKGVITPKNNNSKVVQNLFKTAMKDYPDRGMPAFVIPEGTPQYKEIIKKFGTNIGSSDGEHGVAWAVPPGGGGFTVWPPNHPPMAPGLSARGPHPKTGKMTIRNLNTPYKPVPRRGPNTPGWGTQPGDPGYGGGGGGRGFGNALGKLFLGILGILDLTAGKAHAPIFIPPFLTNPDTPTPGAIPIGMDDPYYNWGSVPIPPGGFGNPQGQQAPTGRDARIARIANVKQIVKNRQRGDAQRQGYDRGLSHRRKRETPQWQLKDVPLKHKDPTTGPPLGPVFPTWGDDDAYRRKLDANKPGQKVVVVGMPEDPGSGVMDNEYYNPPGNPDDINVGYPDNVDPNQDMYYYQRSPSTWR